MLRFLIKREDACEFEAVLARDFNKIDKNLIIIDTNDSVAKAPYLKYRLQIFDFYTSLLNGKTTLENSVILGALAAKKSRISLPQ